MCVSASPEHLVSSCSVSFNSLRLYVLKTKQKTRRNFKDDPVQTFHLSAEKDTPKEVK